MADRRRDKVKEWLIGYHWHPPSVHFHSALFPTAAILLVIYVLSHESSWERASFYVLSLGVLMLAGSILAGFFDWYTKYKAAQTKIFRTKIWLSLVLLAVGVILVIWRALSPELMQGGVFSRGLYITGLLLAVLLVIWIGYLGGKLIFRRQQ